MQIHASLKSTEQANKAASAANRMIGILKNSFVHRGVDLWKRLYTTYIRPNLEFAISAWNPHLQKDINVLEKVQRRATRIPHFMKSYEYEDRCKIWGITSLSDRRKRGDLIQKYKIETGQDMVMWHTQPEKVVVREGERPRYHREKTKNAERHEFFNNRIANAWNLLPNEIVNATSVNDFKKKLDEKTSCHS